MRVIWSLAVAAALAIGAQAALAAPTPAPTLLAKPGASVTYREHGFMWGGATVTLYGDGRVEIERYVHRKPQRAQGRLTPAELAKVRRALDGAVKAWKRHVVDGVHAAALDEGVFELDTSEGLRLSEPAHESYDDPSFITIKEIFSGLVARFSDDSDS